MSQYESQYQREEYLEQDDDEVETAGRVKSVVALLVMAILVVAGVLLVERLHETARVEDCLLAHGAHCDDLVEPPKPAGVR